MDSDDEGGFFVNGDFGLRLSLKKVDNLCFGRAGECGVSWGGNDNEAADETRDMVDWFMLGGERCKNGESDGY
jgi:hypothetical protein